MKKTEGISFLIGYDAYDGGLSHDFNYSDINFILFKCLRPRGTHFSQFKVFKMILKFQFLT